MNLVALPRGMRWRNQINDFDLAESWTHNCSAQSLRSIRGVSHQHDTEEPDRVAPCF